jgi:uncharacterized protein RhaS with RHS repeats
VGQGFESSLRHHKLNSAIQCLVAKFVYDKAGHLVGEYTGAGALIQETLWLGDLPVATLRPNGSGISVYYVHADQLGTPIMVTRPADNAIMWRLDIDPFGTVAPNQNPQAQGLFIYNLRFPRMSAIAPPSHRQLLAVR